MRFALVFAVLLTAAGLARGSEATAADLLDLASGAVVMSSTSEYGGGWSAFSLIDGGTGSGWCSSSGAAFPHTFVFELPQPCAITSFAVDNTGAEESATPGISSKGIVIYGSSTSSTTGLTELAAFDAPQAGRKEANLGSAPTVQWLKVVVNSNWGDPDFTEVMELEAYGQPVGAPPVVSVSGVYQTTYGAMRVQQDGTNVAGCYDWEGGQLTGSLNGRVMQFEWRENEGEQVGSAIMVLSVAGDALNGVWFENGQLMREWVGERGGAPPECTVPRGGTIAAKLAETGRAVLYGIYFDSGSATLKPESDKTLGEIRAALEGEPGLTLVVAGHTDSTNTDEFNMGLSQKRAEEVVAWLVARGVEASRLTAKGFGESQPVADNGTATGRVLNRRVELLTGE